MTEELREGFEAWASLADLRKDDDGEYRDPLLERDWLTWQAAIACIRQHDDWQPSRGWWRCGRLLRK